MYPVVAAATAEAAEAAAEAAAAVAAAVGAASVSPSSRLTWRSQQQQSTKMASPMCENL